MPFELIESHPLGLPRDSFLLCLLRLLCFPLLFLLTCLLPLPLTAGRENTSQDRCRGDERQT